MEKQFFAYLSRMKYIHRWALMHSARTETLSEHTLETAILTHALCLLRNEHFGGQCDAGRAVLCALYHDAAETITGDLPTPVKYYSPRIREAYGELEQAAGERLLQMLPDSLRQAYREQLFCQDEEILRLVKAADKLSALIKCIEEERMGNREFACAKQAALHTLHQMRLPEVELFLKEFLPAYQLALDELE
ncbi:MAG: 5'-deoxynucleotidase [Provencibacterium sp.]|nr:5'-deoxynucleotidase [Provencibacterium sp.]